MLFTDIKVVDFVKLWTVIFLNIMHYFIAEYSYTYKTRLMLYSFLQDMFLIRCLIILQISNRIKNGYVVSNALHLNWVSVFNIRIQAALKSKHSHQKHKLFFQLGINMHTSRKYCITVLVYHVLGKQLFFLSDLEILAYFVLVTVQHLSLYSFR